MSKSAKWLIGGITILVVAAVLGGGLWWFFRDDAPAKVDLDAAAQSVDTAPTSAAQGAPTPDVIEGTWKVDAASGDFDFKEATGTFAGFRIEEELAGIGSTTAVGRTDAVSGSLTITGTTVTVGKIEVDLSQVTTNDSRRDRQVSRAFRASTDASFVLTQPVELGAGAANGETVAFDAVGDLTVNGTTRSVTWPIEARLVNGTIVAVGSLEIEFDDYDVKVPSSQIVLSVEDHGILEFQLLFTRA